MVGLFLNAPPVEGRARLGGPGGLPGNPEGTPWARGRPRQQRSVTLVEAPGGSGTLALQGA
eukprot:1737035-Pyramimonas_sp.AAC.1